MNQSLLAGHRRRRHVHRLQRLRHADRRARSASRCPRRRRLRGGACAPGLDRLASEHGVDLGEIGTVVHGTTIAVNTLIQRTGARLGLLVTEGFRDVLELQRLRLPNPFDLDGAPAAAPDPAARGGRGARAPARRRQRRHAARRGPARRGASGAWSSRDVEGLVISLLHAYRNPAHERRARGDRRGRGPRPARQRLVGGLAAGPRVRADGAGRARRLRAAEGAPLPGRVRARRSPRAASAPRPT